MAASYVTPRLADGSKACRRCKLVKPLFDFHKNVKCKDGHLATCKPCRADRDAPYVEAHREETRQRANAWRLANPEESLAKAAAWAAKNPDKVRAISHKHRHSAQGKVAAKKYVAERRCPEARKATSKRYYESNKDRYRNYVRNRRALSRGADGSHTKDDVARIAQHQGMRCVYCKAKLIGFQYHADHKMPLALGGSNDAGNIQALCPTCNKRKGKKDPIAFAQECGLLL